MFHAKTPLTLATKNKASLRQVGSILHAAKSRGTKARAARFGQHLSASSTRHCGLDLAQPRASRRFAPVAALPKTARIEAGHIGYSPSNGLSRDFLQTPQIRTGVPYLSRLTDPRDRRLPGWRREYVADLDSSGVLIVVFRFFSTRCTHSLVAKERFQLLGPASTP